MIKEMLLMAKSSKGGGLCLAGLEVRTSAAGQRVLTNNWIRPVSLDCQTTNNGAIPFAACENIGVLDIIRIKLAGPAPQAGQSENWLWDSTPLQKIGSLPESYILHKVAARSQAVWYDSATDRDDQISHAQIRDGSPQPSLMLVEPQNLVFELELHETARGLKKRVYTSFEHNGCTYRRITVTDPVIRRVFNRQFPTVPGGVIQKRLNNGDSYWLTLSLAPCFGARNCHYILAAAIIDQSGYLNRNYR